VNKNFSELEDHFTQYKILNERELDELK